MVVSNSPLQLTQALDDLPVYISTQISPSYLNLVF